MVVDLDYLGDDIVDRAREYIEMVDLELMGLTLKNGTRQETFNMVASLQLKNAMNRSIVPGGSPRTCSRSPIGALKPKGGGIGNSSAFTPVITNTLTDVPIIIVNQNNRTLL